MRPRHLPGWRPFVATVAIVAAAPVKAGAEGTRDGGSSPPDVRTAMGTIASISFAEHTVTIATEDGRVRLRFDRNTSVFVPGHVGTIQDLAAGAPVRASFGLERLAYWIEVGAAPAAERDATSDRKPDGGGPPALPPPRGDRPEENRPAAAARESSPPRGDAIR